MKLLAMFILLRAMWTTEMVAQNATGRLELGRYKHWKLVPVTSPEGFRLRGASTRWYFRQDSSEQWRRAGFGCKRLLPLLANDPLARQDYRKYRKLHWAGVGCKAAGFGGFVLGVTATFFNALSSLGGSRDKALTNYTLIGFGAGVGLNIGGQVLHHKADRRLVRAVQAHNEGLSIAPVPREKATFCLRPMIGTTYAGVGAVWQF